MYTDVQSVFVQSSSMKSVLLIIAVYSSMLKYSSRPDYILEYDCSRSCVIHSILLTDTSFYPYTFYITDRYFFLSLYILYY